MEPGVFDFDLDQDTKLNFGTGDVRAQAGVQLVFGNLNRPVSYNKTAKGFTCGNIHEFGNAAFIAEIIVAFRGLPRPRMTFRRTSSEASTTT